MQHPRCVFQILKRHFARYTPEMVEQICGVPPELFAPGVRGDHRQLRPRPHDRLRLRRRLDPAHRRRPVHPHRVDPADCCSATSAGPAAASWPCAGHATIQGSTDIPTLFDILPGYIPMPHAHEHDDLDTFIGAESADKGFWADMKAYMVSLLKA